MTVVLAAAAVVTAGEAERTEVTGQGVGGSTGIRPTHARSATGPGYKDLMQWEASFRV